jgi:mono/diheme cytochrome c family protein
MRWVTRGLTGFSLLLLAWLGYPIVREAVLRPEASRPLRGLELARANGCFACHGAEGRGGVANPGSRRETIPGLTGSTLMMYVHDEAEIRQYILDGRPARLADDPDYRAEIAAQAIAMPAFRAWMTTDEIDLIVSYVRVISGMIQPEDELVRRGLAVADRMGCFGCHGALGMGGRKNPGSLKGYVPSFMGEDFRELVRSDAELHEWIRKGRLARLESQFLASWFVRVQLVKMPAFERFLADGELDALVALIRWIQAGGPEKRPLSLE